MHASKQYLPHIDGLRAIAVISVILFHFGFSSFRGGYVGVDMFFVISGYLITRIIFSEIDETGEFRFKNFYIRRIRRLFPALLFTVFVTACISVLLFTPENLKQFGSSLVASVFSISNILFWKESGYFDTSSNLKPLLHTWSLSVEEQFYLFWPIFLVVLSSARLRSRRVAIIIVTGLVSFFANYLWVYGGFDIDYKSTIFFLTPFRIFEFVIGALGVHISRKMPKSKVLNDASLLIGIVFIICSVLFYTELMVFPYYYAILPCIGTLLVILSAEARLIWLIENRPMITIGKISYSLYLAHWPIIVFFQYYVLREPTQIEIGLMLVLNFILAIFMYYFIEQPFRAGRKKIEMKLDSKSYVYKIFSLMVLSGACGFFISNSDGMVWRYSYLWQHDSGNIKVIQPLTPDEIEIGKSKRYTYLRNGCRIDEVYKSESCQMNRPIQMLFFGNSHEPDGYNAFREIYADSKDVNLIYFGTVNGCEFNFSEGSVYSHTEALDCIERFNALNNDKLMRKVNYLVYSANKPFELETESLWTALKLIESKNNNIHLIVLGGYLNNSIECATIYNRTGSYDNCKSEGLITYVNFDELEHTKVALANDKKFLYINKYKMLCPEMTLQSCAVEGGGEPYTYDQHHLSFGFSKYVGKLIEKFYYDDLIALGLPPTMN